VQHEYVYPTVRPIPPRAVDAEPERWWSWEGAASATGASTLTAGPRIAGPAVASPLAVGQSVQAPPQPAW
jgi:hypothetical protein